MLKIMLVCFNGQLRTEIISGLLRVFNDILICVDTKSPLMGLPHEPVASSGLNHV